MLRMIGQYKSAKQLVQKLFVVNLPLALQIGLFTEVVNGLLTQHSLGDDLYLSLGQVPAVFPVEDAEDFDDVLT